MLTDVESLQLELEKSPAVKRFVPEKMKDFIDHTFGVVTRKCLCVALFEKGKVEIAKKLLSLELTVPTKAEKNRAEIKKMV